MKKNVETTMKQIFIFLFFIGVNTYAQMTLQVVAPLKHLNDCWVYEEWDETYSTLLGIFNYCVIDSAKYVDSIKYFEIAYGIFGDGRVLLRLREDGFYVARRDTSFQAPNHEQIYYKKDAHYGDQWVGRAIGTPDSLYFSVIDTAVSFVFGETITLKLININNGENGLLDINQIWSEEFGLIASEVDVGIFTYILKGCALNGVVYGDTTTTSVGADENLIPDYSLSQNYPNPFNSSTTIEYEISSQSYVSLTVYNSIGESVSNLVNEIQAQGKYRIRFFADNLSSGTYFYRLTNGKKSIIKKLVILK
jgi:hypothetical protein